ncbi:MAG: GDSL-type esterase/lipase family protein [Planctomycetota bacterium]
MKRRWVYFLVLCAVMTIPGGCSVWQTSDPYGLEDKTHSAVVPVPQTDEWWMPRHERVLERVAEGNVDLIMIGDSITHGWEEDSEALWDQYYAPRNAVNMGFSGDRTQHVLWRIADGIKAICAKMRTKLPKTKILILAIFPRGKVSSPPRAKNAKASELASEIADGKKIYYLDINDHFLDDDGTLPKDVMPDLLHPNTNGYRIWAEAVEPTIANLMGEK